MLIAIIFILSIASSIASFIALIIVLQYAKLTKEDLLETKDNEAILISGCDSGIGLQLVKYFHKTTKFKLICGFLSIQQSQGYDELSKIKESDNDNRIILIKLDLTSSDDVDNLITRIEQLRRDKTFDQLVALINNAGIMTYGEFDWLTWNHIITQIDVNLIGTIRLTRAVLPYIIESRGRIVNVSSVNDVTVFPGLSIYSATKCALSTFSRGLGYELRKFGVSVITIRLGDFARLTNIMSRHESYQSAMWEEMSQKKKTMYKDFFHEFNGHLLKNYGMTSPRGFEDSSLFRDFNRAILSKHPPSVVTCAPITFRIFYFVIELMPVWVQYHLLDFLIEYGFRWKPPPIIVNNE